MPRSAAPRRPPAAPDVVRARSRAGDHVEACAQARALVAADAANRPLLLEVLAPAARAAADAGKFAEAFALADESANAGASEEAVAPLRARAGRCPAGAPRALLGQLADFALMHGRPEPLPAEWHADYKAIRAAFAAEEPTAARAALDAVGLRSPFLEWKLLHRALASHARGDDADAAECRRRLPAERLPASLAALALDAPVSDPLLEKLVALRRDLGSARGMAAAFRAAESALPELTKRSPDAPGKLARAFYKAIAHHGEQGDLKKFKKLFGAPPDDPQFHRLEALAWEEAGELARANDHWQNYERWLATSPAGWPADVLRRARAVLLVRVATNAEKMKPGPEEEGFFEDLPPAARDLFEQFAAKMGGRSGAKLPAADPLACLQKARDLDPEWDVPGAMLVGRHAAAGDLAAAEAEAARVLAANPKATGALVPLAAALHAAGRPADALAKWDRVLAANPLDKSVRSGAANSAFAAARQAVAAGDLAKADALLARRAELNPDAGLLPPAALTAVLRLLQKRPADADAAKAVAHQWAKHPAGALAHLVAEALLAKLKPAQRKPWEAEYAALLAGPPHPHMVYGLVRCADYYAGERLDFRGRAAMEKKALALAVECVNADAPAEAFEDMVLILPDLGHHKPVEKAAPLLRRRFAASPVFPLAEARAEYAKTQRPSRKMANNLSLARTLAERSADPRHKQLLPIIAKLQDELFGDLWD